MYRIISDTMCITVHMMIMMFDTNNGSLVVQIICLGIESNSDKFVINQCIDRHIAFVFFSNVIRHQKGKIKTIL